jgi:hypothetical protein
VTLSTPTLISIYDCETSVHKTQVTDEDFGWDGTLSHQRNLYQ